ncbi:MAG TPA: penicillin-binding protein 2 [Dermatophilaceae bacterium]|nr:penicillin-binding protein 2 [Dermatophilaceae bacterium]
MRALTIAVLFVFSVFGAQLLRLQGLDASAVAAEALASRTQSVSVPALRGRVLSADGVVLASSRERVTVVADPTAVCTYGTTKPSCAGIEPAERAAAVEAVVDRLGPVIGMSPTELRPKLSAPGRYSVLSRAVSPLTWRRIEDLGLPGISKDARGDASTAQRVYPQGPTAASLVGYLTQDGGAPGGGVELMMNGRLAGRPGTAVNEIAADGSPIPGGRHSVAQAVDGQDVPLTINANLQWYAQNALAQKVTETQALSGTVVVMDARTGQLLTVASYPTFDPNDVGNARGPLSNLALSEVFEPGSTAKIMTIAAAMEEKHVTPSTPLVIPGRIHRYDTWFKDSHDHPTEYRTVTGALAESSNIGTVLVGETMRSRTLESYFRKFGLGATSGMGFPGESAGLLPPVRQWSGTQETTVMFGQGVSVTAVQAASVFQTIANDGVRMPPRLVRGSTDADGTFHPAAPPQGVRVVRSDVATDVSRMLEGVVTKDGTAPQARIPGYRVAGKTGTADRYVQVSTTKGGYSGKTASFIGYAPADDPRLVVAVIVQRPLKGYYGGTTAAPVFKDVMTYALQELKVPPTGADSPQLTLRLSRAEAESDPTVLRDRRSGSAG